MVPERNKMWPLVTVRQLALISDRGLPSRPVTEINARASLSVTRFLAKPARSSRRRRFGIVRHMMSSPLHLVIMAALMIAVMAIGMMLMR